MKRRIQKVQRPLFLSWMIMTNPLKISTCKPQELITSPWKARELKWTSLTRSLSFLLHSVIRIQSMSVEDVCRVALEAQELISKRCGQRNAFSSEQEEWHPCSSAAYGYLLLNPHGPENLTGSLKVENVRPVAFFTCKGGIVSCAFPSLRVKNASRRLFLIIQN